MLSRYLAENSPTDLTSPKACPRGPLPPRHHLSVIFDNAGRCSCVGLCLAEDSISRSIWPYIWVTCSYTVFFTRDQSLRANRFFATRVVRL